jgi:hypothetical protein
MVHSATGLTPEDAKKEENEFFAKTNLEVKRISNRKYPELAVGNRVKVYKKKRKGAKEHVSFWEDQPRTVTSIQIKHGQKLYSLNNSRNVFIRSNLVKVKPQK